MKQLVVAKYKEDVGWIDKIQGWWPVVYDKWEAELPNYPGREAHTYLHYICRNYDLWMDPEWTITEVGLIQGNPFDHDPKFLEHLADDGVRTYGDIYNCLSDGGPHMANAHLDELCIRVGIKPRNVYYFVAGAQFRVTVEQIRQHPIEVYEFLLAYSKLGATPQCAWVLERFLPTLFGIL